MIITRHRVDDYRARLARTPLHLVVLNPGKRAAAGRDATRAKSRRQVARTGVSVADRWAHLEGVMTSELAGVGLWIQSANQTPARTVDMILAAEDRSRID